MIKSHYLLGLLGIIMLSFTQVQADTSSPHVLARIQFTLNNQPVVVALYDNAASQQLLKQLPLTLELSDFANEEKIATLPTPLTTQGVQLAKLQKSDFTYYAPWGNLAIFYKGYGQAQGVYALGIIESGKEQLLQLKGNTQISLVQIK